MLASIGSTAVSKRKSIILNSKLHVGIISLSIARITEMPWHFDDAECVQFIFNFNSISEVFAHKR